MRPRPTRVPPTAGATAGTSETTERGPRASEDTAGGSDSEDASSDTKDADAEADADEDGDTDTDADTNTDADEDDIDEAPDVSEEDADADADTETDSGSDSTPVRDVPVRSAYAMARMARKINSASKIRTVALIVQKSFA